MSILGLEALFAPKRIAVFDVSDEEGTRGAEIFKHLLWQGFKGAVYPVSPRAESVFGIETYPDLLSIPKPVDLAIITENPPRWEPQLEQCRKKGIKAVLILGLDYKDRDPEAQKTIAKLKTYVSQGSFRLLGPNSLGFIRPIRRLNASLFPGRIVPGGLAFLSDSATLSAAVLDWIENKNIGLSFFVSLGEKIDVDLADLIDYLALDPHTHAIVAYVEKIKTGRKFMSAARAFARFKPIMVVKAGGLAPKGGDLLSSLALEAKVYQAAFKRAGIVQVEEILELFYVAESLAKQPRPKGPRLALVTNAGGPAKLAKDTLLNMGGKLASFSASGMASLQEILNRPPQNPVDLLSDATPGLYREVLRVLLREPEVDGVLVIYSPLLHQASEEFAWAVVRASREQARKPILVSFMGEDRVKSAQHILKKEQIPFFMTPVEAVKSFIYMYRYDHHLRLLFETPGTILESFVPDKEKVEAIIKRARENAQSELKGNEALEVLEAYGFGQGEEPKGSIPFSFFLGSIRDEVFGTVILFGLGGPYLLAEKDYALGFPPLNQTLARRMLEETKIFSYLLKEKPASTLILEEFLVRFSHLLVDFPEIEEILLNPVYLGGEKLWVKEARIVLDLGLKQPFYIPRGHYCPAHLAICPYPSHFTFEVCLRDGKEVLIRPIKPEDEPLMQALFYSFSPETIRLRFMQPKKTITHEELARFCHIDYDRELALVAITQEEGEKKIIGVVRLIRLPDETSAEMAVVVGDPWQGKGLGRVLCEIAIRVAKEMGLRRLFMDILVDNQRMLRLAEKLGFKVVEREDDLVRVALALS